MTPIVNPEPQSAAEATLMFAEARGSAEAVKWLFAANRPHVRDLAQGLRACPPTAAITCARGSSDNAATYGRYLIETRLGVVSGSLGLSVASIYRAPFRLPGGLAVAISQSGASPDLLAATEQAKVAGATTLALVNTPGSPLGAVADHVIELSAGPERSVAATKSFIASLAALACLVAEWEQDRELLAEIERLPELLDQAWALDWSAALPTLVEARNGFVLGRGPGLAIAQEGALKLKETCRIHGEALSAAEVEHGPMALARPGFVALVFAQDDPTHAGTMAIAELLMEHGATVIVAGADVPGAINLPFLAAHPLLQPILLIQSFYRLAAELSVARGMDPDHPPHLQKVTRTM
jgi:glucosamine--fructose-6-phosphate aminotransferase (isomerizing)